MNLDCRRWACSETERQRRLRTCPGFRRDCLRTAETVGKFTSHTHGARNRFPQHLQISLPLLVPYDVLFEQISGLGDHLQQVVKLVGSSLDPSNLSWIRHRSL